LHTILATIIAVVWRCNKLAIYTGIYLNNPWTIAPIVAASWAIGRWLIGAPAVELPHVTLSALATMEFWRMIGAQWRQLLPFALGATILSVVSAAVTYPLMLYTLRAYRRKRGDQTLVVTESITKQS